ncbi:hypothetical protein [Streptomyces antimycoticus]|uniref:hypothetical protein n=1 Tax=Streptomyces antimycoticus TaxID=68175 RepID=UPI0036E21C03
MTGPNGETTLPQVLLDAADAAPGQVLVPVRGDGGERTVTFARLRDEPLRVAVGGTERHIADYLPPAAASGYAERSWLPGTIASRRLVSLPHTAVSGLPLVHGLVNASHAHAYWDAVEAAGVSAAPLRLLGHTIATEPPSHRATEPPSHRATEPPSHRGTEPSWHGTTSHGTS